MRIVLEYLLSIMITQERRLTPIIQILSSLSIDYKADSYLLYLMNKIFLKILSELFLLWVIESPKGFPLISIPVKPVGQRALPQGERLFASFSWAIGGLWNESKPAVARIDTGSKVSKRDQRVSCENPFHHIGKGDPRVPKASQRVNVGREIICPEIWEPGWEQIFLEAAGKRVQSPDYTSAQKPITRGEYLNRIRGIRGAQHIGGVMN